MCLACLDFQKGNLDFEEFMTNRQEYTENVEHQISEEEVVKLFAELLITGVSFEEFMTNRQE